MGITNKKIIDAFKNTGGIVSKAALKLGVSRQAVYSRIQKSEELAKEQQSAKETALDLAEDKLLSNIKAGDNTCIIFFLKTQGKKRGYVEKQEVEQSGSLNLNSAPQIVFNDPKTDKSK
jgi:transposase